MVKLRSPGGEQMSMPSPEKDQFSCQGHGMLVDFQDGLTSDKRKYPLQQFKAFWAVTKRYAELTWSDPLIRAAYPTERNPVSLP
jgi:hypothetical protein